MKVTRELNTDIRFTKEACELFKKVINNQNAIINKHDEIEMLVKKNSELFAKSKTLSEYLTIGAS